MLLQGIPPPTGDLQGKLVVYMGAVRRLGWQLYSLCA